MDSQLNVECIMLACDWMGAFSLKLHGSILKNHVKHDNSLWSFVGVTYSWYGIDTVNLHALTVCCYPELCACIFTYKSSSHVVPKALFMVSIGLLLVPLSLLLERKVC